MMRVLLINPSVGYYTRALSNPLGLLSIGTYLKQHGHCVKIYDRCVDKTKLKKILQDFKPQIIGVSVMSSRGLKDAMKISEFAKKSGITVVWGGQLPSMQTQLILENPYVDAVSLSEGEETWLELVSHIENGRDYSDVKGVALKRDNRIKLNECREFSDLKDMPVSDWSLLDVPKYMQNYLGCSKMMYIYSSKGCCGRCTFCSNVNFHKSTHRKRPNEYVISEIEYLIDNYGLDGVFFSDELWCIKRSDLIDFCERIHEKGLKFQWGVQLRIGMFNEEDFRRMYDAGCRWIFFGIESGSDEMLKKINKNIDKNKIKPTVDMLRKIGITTICSFIIGFPGETEEQLKDTVKLIDRINANLTPVYHLTPLPGTQIYDQLVSQGRFEAPKDLKELSGVIATESLGKNLSCVPSVDLRVIRSWYHWKGFTNKNAYTSGKSFEFAKQTVISGLHAISLKGFISFIVNGFAAFYELLYVFWYSHAYPGVIKKYNLK